MPRRDLGHQPDPEVQVQELRHRPARPLRPQEHSDGIFILEKYLYGLPIYSNNQFLAASLAGIHYLQLRNIYANIVLCG